MAPIQLSAPEHQIMSHSSVYTGVYILIGASTLTMLVGLPGRCEGVQESQCMLGCFVFLLVVAALEIAVAIWGYSHKDEIQELQKCYTNTYLKLKSKDEFQQEMLKAIHYWLNCCGVAGGVERFISDICSQRRSQQEIKRLSEALP